MIISGVMALSMPRLSSSPQRPQLPRAPHLPLTVQGAGSFASLSSRGYVGACCCAWALPSSQSTPSTRLPTPTIRDVHERCIASSFQGAMCREGRHAGPLAPAHAIRDLCGGVVTQGNSCALTLSWHLWPVNMLVKGQDGAPTVSHQPVVFVYCQLERVMHFERGYGSMDAALERHPRASGDPAHRD